MLLWARDHRWKSKLLVVKNQASGSLSGSCAEPQFEPHAAGVTYVRQSRASPRSAQSTRRALNAILATSSNERYRILYVESADTISNPGDLQLILFTIPRAPHRLGNEASGERGALNAKLPHIDCRTEARLLTNVTAVEGF